MSFRKVNLQLQDLTGIFFTSSVKPETRNRRDRKKHDVI